MYIHSLELKDYRNYDELSISFDEGTNIIYGDNAQGKTNILEALYLASTTKSHRGSKDKDIIQFEKEESHIRLKVMKKDVPHKIDMHLRKHKSKGVAIDGIPIHKSMELLGILNIIFFSPEDLSIIKNSPAERRKFMDLELCQLDKIYCYHFMNYNKVLNQRNNLLKQIYFNPSLIDTLDIWDEQLAQYGKKVIEGRKQFIVQLNEIIKEIHGNLTGGKEKIKIVYDCNTEEDLFNELKKKRDKDLKYQTTQVGPHRDDMKFLINHIDVRSFGSQGQQRTVALSLKLAEIKLVNQLIGDKPILLLDDVMSELDEKRRDYLFRSIHDVQTIITCTGYDDFIKKRLSINQVYKVVEGHIYLQ